MCTCVCHCVCLCVCVCVCVCVSLCVFVCVDIRFTLSFPPSLTPSLSLSLCLSFPPSLLCLSIKVRTKNSSNSTTPLATSPVPLSMAVSPVKPLLSSAVTSANSSSLANNLSVQSIAGEKEAFACLLT